MRKSSLVLGSLFILLAVAILVFAEGPRRWYSGLFFALLGTVAVLNAVVRRDSDQE